MPKFNMYQSLHTTVIGPEGKAVEIQIRTHTMHRRAEYGVAAHYKYKEEHKRGGRGAPAESDSLAETAWLRRLLDWQREIADPGEFLDSLRFEINARRGLRLHPQGRGGGVAGRVHPGRFRVCRAHRGRTPLHRWPGQRPVGTSGFGPGERRFGRDPHVQGRRGWAVAGLALVRQEPPGPQQDPPMVHQGAPRGGDRAGQGGDRQVPAQAGPSAASAHVRREPHRGGCRFALRRYRQPLRCRR